MAYKMATGNGPNIGNVLPTTDLTDPKKTDPKNKKQAQAQANADQAAASSEKIYGQTTTTRERTAQDGVSGTLFTTTRPYTQSGTGESTMSYEQFGAKGGDVKAAKKWNAEQSYSGQNVSSRFLPDATILKPMPMAPYKPEIKADGIKPTKKVFNFNDPSGRHFNMQQVNQNFGGLTRTSQTSEPVTNIYTGVNPNWGDKNYGNVTKSRPMTNYENSLLSSNFGVRTGGLTATPYGKGGEEGLKRYLGQIEEGLIKQTNTINARKKNQQPKRDAWEANKAEKQKSKEEKINARKKRNN